MEYFKVISLSWVPRIGPWGGEGGGGGERVEKERKKKEEKEEKGSGKRSLPVIEILTAGISPRRVSTVCHLSVFCGPH